MAKKAYVVWAGRKPGVYDTWAETKAQTEGFPGARFKGFGSRDEAEAVFGGKTAMRRPTGSSQRTSGAKAAVSGRPTGQFLTVDAAYSHSTKICEWRGVLVDGDQQTEVFRSGRHQGGSANVGELLGIVDGMKYLRENGLSIPLYSDSYNAQAWIKRKTHNSTAKRSEALSQLLEDGIRYLKATPNKGAGVYVKIVDWKTSQWGEIPADFGRK